MQKKNLAQEPNPTPRTSIPARESQSHAPSPKKSSGEKAGWLHLKLPCQPPGGTRCRFRRHSIKTLILEIWNGMTSYRHVCSEQSMIILCIDTIV